MSFSATIEHIYIGPDDLPKTLAKTFPNGACVIFSDEEFVAAIPATNDETNELADLVDIAAISFSPDDPAMKAYYARRDELCGGTHHLVLTAAFKREMDLEFNRDT